jgi:hypothetical protein
MIYAFDYLGGAMFGREILKAHPSNYGAGFFADTFGDCFPVAKRLAASRKCPLIRIHGPWTNHLYSPSRHDAAIFKAFNRTKKLAALFPSVRFQFSPVCESSARGTNWQQLFKRLIRDAGPVEIICSIWRGEAVSGVKLEVHGKERAPGKPYQYSYDGTSAVDSDIESDKRKHSRADVFFFWHPSFNLKYKTELSGDEAAHIKRNDTAAPTRRNCKPTPELIKSLAALADDKGNTSLKARNLYKSHSDRHQTPPEKRAYKPVLISPIKAECATLGNTRSEKREPYKDGRYRYYFSKYGYQLGRGALRVGSTEVGFVNGAFREGDFR